MKHIRIMLAAPFFGAGLIFMGIAGFIIGDQHVDWLDASKPTHH